MKKKIFFVHIPKTGGSSFNKFLSTHFIGKEHCECYLTVDGQFANPSHLQELDYISAHMSFFVFESNSFPRQEYYLTTFIRDPISQLISHLNWVMYIADVSPDFFAAQSSAIQDISLELRSLDLYNIDTLVSALKKFHGLFRNNQSRYFAKNFEISSQEAVIETMSQLDMIGILERYDESIGQFARLYNLKFDGKHREVANKNPNCKVGKDILENQLIYEFLHEYNAHDIKMYNHFYPLAVQNFQDGCHNDSQLSGLSVL